MSYSEEARRKANHQVGDLYLKAVAHGHIPSTSTGSARAASTATVSVTATVKVQPA